MYNAKVFATRLKQLREEKGWNQDQLADKLRLTRTSIINYESGKRTPNIEIFSGFQNVFDVDYEYLTGESEYRMLPEAQRIANQYDEILLTIHHLPLEQQEKMLILFKKLSKLGLHDDMDIHFEEISVFQAVINTLNAYTEIADKYSLCLKDIRTAIGGLKYSTFPKIKNQEGKIISKRNFIDYLSYEFTELVDTQFEDKKSKTNSLRQDLIDTQSKLIYKLQFHLHGKVTNMDDLD
jgi:transcriptional regulator with XRE-family HTH domain